MNIGSNKTLIRKIRNDLDSLGSTFSFSFTPSSYEEFNFGIMTSGRFPGDTSHLFSTKNDFRCVSGKIFDYENNFWGSYKKGRSNKIVIYDGYSFDFFYNDYPIRHSVAISPYSADGQNCFYVKTTSNVEIDFDLYISGVTDFGNYYINCLIEGGEVSASGTATIHVQDFGANLTVKSLSMGSGWKPLDTSYSGAFFQAGFDYYFPIYNESFLNLPHPSYIPLVMEFLETETPYSGNLSINNPYYLSGFSGTINSKLDLGGNQYLYLYGTGTGISGEYDFFTSFYTDITGEKISIELEHLGSENAVYNPYYYTGWNTGIFSGIVDARISYLYRSTLTGYLVTESGLVATSNSNVQSIDKLYSTGYVTGYYKTVGQGTGYIWSYGLTGIDESGNNLSGWFASGTSIYGYLTGSISGSGLTQANSGIVKFYQYVSGYPDSLLFYPQLTTGLNSGWLCVGFLDEDVAISGFQSHANSGYLTGALQKLEGTGYFTGLWDLTTGLSASSGQISYKTNNWYSASPRKYVAPSGFYAPANIGVNNIFIKLKFTPLQFTQITDSVKIKVSTNTLSESLTVSGLKIMNRNF